MPQPRTDTLPNKVKRVLMALAVFFSCYVVIVTLYQLSVGALCVYFGYSPTVTFNAILGLPIEPGSWSRFSITVVFVGASLILMSLLTGGLVVPLHLYVSRCFG